MSTPYLEYPDRAFWSRAIASSNMLALRDVYQKKFDIGLDDKIVTAGSCFAQHIAKRLRRSGYRYMDYEPAPFFFGVDRLAAFNYGVYSARYCNIYTVRQLRQTFERAFDMRRPVEETWACGNGVLDPFRPIVEPGPYPSHEEFTAARDAHLRAVRQVFSDAQLFIFTFGLTEAWVSRLDGSVFPVCPGTRAPWNKAETLGGFEPALHEFRNFGFRETLADFEWLIESMRRINPGVKFLLTVSPVPLAATASGKNVLSATAYSKSVLRAVAGELADNDAGIDYFPSYELVASHPMRGAFFEPNLRNVAAEGVDQVMKHFFRVHRLPDQPVVPAPPSRIEDAHLSDVVCEEILQDQERTVA